MVLALEVTDERLRRVASQQHGYIQHRLCLAVLAHIGTIEAYGQTLSQRHRFGILNPYFIVALQIYEHTRTVVLGFQNLQGNNCLLDTRENDTSTKPLKALSHYRKTSHRVQGIILTTAETIPPHRNYPTTESSNRSRWSVSYHWRAKRRERTLSEWIPPLRSAALLSGLYQNW